MADRGVPLLLVVNMTRTHAHTCARAHRRRRHHPECFAVSPLAKCATAVDSTQQFRSTTIFGSSTRRPIVVHYYSRSGIPLWGGMPDAPLPGAPGDETDAHAAGPSPPEGIDMFETVEEGAHWHHPVMRPYCKLLCALPPRTLVWLVALRTVTPPVALRRYGSYICALPSHNGPRLCAPRSKVTGAAVHVSAGSNTRGRCAPRSAQRRAWRACASCWSWIIATRRPVALVSLLNQLAAKNQCCHSLWARDTITSPESRGPGSVCCT